MRIHTLPNEFLQAIPVITAIEEAGFEAYFVGGSVRDIMLDHQIHDVDIATSAFPEEIKHIFPKTIDVGIEHGTVLVLHEEEQYEITTFRTESTYQDYRRPDQVTFVRSLEEDLKRRDFTMNALAMNKEGEIIDLFNGIEAIKQRKIVAVGKASERFHEDALRMMRGLRFSSQLGFEIESKTKQAIEEHHPLLEKISVERIYVEWTKLLLGDYRNKGLSTFIETKCFEYCPGLNQESEALRELLKLSESHRFETEEIAWTILCYYLKMKNVSTFLKKWKTSNKMAHRVQHNLEQLIKRETTDWNAWDLYQSGLDTIQDVEFIRGVLFDQQPDETILQAYGQLPIKNMKELAITGKEILKTLETTPGPWMGQLLTFLEKKVVEGVFSNQEAFLLNEAIKWKEEHE